MRIPRTWNYLKHFLSPPPGRRTGHCSITQATAIDAAQPVSTKKTRVLRGARQRDRVVVDLSQSQPARDRISAGVFNGKFSLPSQEVVSLMEENSLTEDELLQLLITPASLLARPPVSSFHVGAVGIGESGALYVGVNLEFARLPLYNSIHAEQFLVVNAAHRGESGIKKLAISAAPCGHCRQFYSELACAESIRFMFGGGTYTLGQLLPMRFRPSDLLPDPTTPLLLEQQDNIITLTATASAEVQRRRNESAFQKAVAEAVIEARNSYAPYSRCPAGVALMTLDGGVYSGGYIESAAYNPGLPPLQTAIIDAVTDGMPSYTKVSEVVLVELENGPVQHAPTTRVALEQIAPGATLTVLLAKNTL